MADPTGLATDANRERSVTTMPTGSGTHRTYTTSFALDEEPISEGGNWINGKQAGLDWADVRTMPGRAYGLEIGNHPLKYDDSTALLAGAWGPDQMAEATVYSLSPRDDMNQEVELRLRSSLSAHICTGYEILFRCLKTDDAYAEIVRWNGPFGDFTYLVQAHYRADVGVATGDVVRATMISNVITAYLNGVKILQATDDTFKTGCPGIGFYLERGTGVNADYGFTRFTASDGAR
jgi:hypothetical protein